MIVKWTKVLTHNNGLKADSLGLRLKPTEVTRIKNDLKSKVESALVGCKLVYEKLNTLESNVKPLKRNINLQSSRR